MTVVSRRTIVLAGLPVHVFSKTDLGEISGNVAVLFLQHGRTGSARGIDNVAETIVKQVAEKGQSKITLLVVTFVSIVAHVRRLKLKNTCRIKGITESDSTTDTPTMPGQRETIDMREFCLSRVYICVLKLSISIDMYATYSM